MSNLFAIENLSLDKWAKREVNRIYKLLDIPELKSTNFSYKLPTDQTAERTQYVSTCKIKWQQGIGDFPICFAPRCEWTHGYVPPCSADVIKWHRGPPASKMSNLRFYQNEDRLSVCRLLILQWKPKLGSLRLAGRELKIAVIVGTALFRKVCNEK